MFTFSLSERKLCYDYIEEEMICKWQLVARTYSRNQGRACCITKKGQETSVKEYSYKFFLNFFPI